MKQNKLWSWSVWFDFFFNLFNEEKTSVISFQRERPRQH